jgi:hypothetical protein
MAPLVTKSSIVSKEIPPASPAENVVNHWLTGAQLRAARGILGISAEELAADAGLSLRTVRRAEQDNGQVQIKPSTAERIVAVLRDRGAIFLPAGAMGEGVRLRNDPPPLFGAKMGSSPIRK